MPWTVAAVLLLCLQYMMTPAAAQSTLTPTPGASASPVASFIQQTGLGDEVPAGLLGPGEHHNADRDRFPGLDSNW
jgi:hypothetical protein